MHDVDIIKQRLRAAAEAVLAAAETQGISHPSIILSLDMLFADPPELWTIHR